MNTNLTNTTIGQYQLHIRIGSGSWGTVYRAQDKNLHRLAAVKLIDVAFNHEPELRDQIMRAARLDSKLAHPAIVPFYNFAHEGEQYYLAMGYVEGMSLRAVLDVLLAWQKRLFLQEILLLMAQVADTLAHAHQEGVWHLNLHPGNILLRPLDKPYRSGEPAVQMLLTDFGMTAVPKAGLQTAVFDLSHYLPYISPEQCVGSRIDGRSDMYNFGAILYELVTGHPLFQIEDASDALTKHSVEFPLPLNTFRDDVPPELERLVRMLTAKKPSERVQLAEQLADILRYIAHDVIEEAAHPDTISLETQFDEMMRVDRALVVEENTPVHPTRLNTGPLMNANRQTPANENGTTETAVVAKPELNMSQQPTPSSGSTLLDTMSTEVSVVPSVNEYLFISRRGSAPKRVRLDKRTILIGRFDKNDIVLDALDVSRQHLRLVQSETGWVVEDLGSRAGSFCNGRKLTPNEPVTWQRDETLIVGSYFLRWYEVESDEQSPQILEQELPPDPKTELFQLPQGGNDVQSTKGLFSAALYPATISLSPGQETVLQVELFNQALAADVYLVMVLGLPAGTAELAQTSVTLTPGARTSLPIAFILPEEGSPKMRSLKAGSYPFQVAICSQTNREEVAVLNGLLLVSPLEAFSVSIWPAQMSNPGNCRVLIRNDGNFTAKYSLIAHDESKQLRFGGQSANITLEPGEAINKKLRIAHHKRPFFGDPYALPFEIEVRTSDGMSETRKAAIRVEPQMPKWVLPFLQFAIVVMLILAVVATIANNRIGQTGGGIDPVPAQQNGGGVVAPDAIDSDGDGLTDTEEANVGTDPNHADSDQDGLTDGNELKNLNLNPLIQDTDEDGLPDGAEVNLYRTNPTVQDSDGDGVNDMDEVQRQTDPLLP